MKYTGTWCDTIGSMQHCLRNAFARSQIWIFTPHTVWREWQRQKPLWSCNLWSFVGQTTWFLQKVNWERKQKRVREGGTYKIRGLRYFSTNAEAESRWSGFKQTSYLKVQQLDFGTLALIMGDSYCIAISLTIFEGYRATYRTTFWSICGRNEGRLDLL